MASRGEWGQRVFGLDICVLARVMAFACRVQGVRVWRVLVRVMVLRACLGRVSPWRVGVGLGAWRFA